MTKKDMFIFIVITDTEIIESDNYVTSKLVKCVFKKPFRTLVENKNFITEVLTAVFTDTEAPMPIVEIFVGDENLAENLIA